MPPTSGQRHNDGGDTLENAPHYHHERATSNNATNGDHHRSTTQPGATILQGDATVPRPVATAGAGSHQPTPLFERLVTEEVQELKAYVRIVENQNRRLEELEQVHGDLERRLEVETRGRKHLEVTLEAREREWKEKFEHLESERDHWKKVVEAEKTKNSRLIDQVVRKDQDIHRMLQRKVSPLLVGPSCITGVFPRFCAHEILNLFKFVFRWICCSTITKLVDPFATYDTGTNLSRTRHLPPSPRNSATKLAKQVKRVPFTRAHTKL